jgi:hypothetical protein
VPGGPVSWRGTVDRTRPGQGEQQERDHPADIDRAAVVAACGGQVGEGAFGNCLREDAEADQGERRPITAGVGEQQDGEHRQNGEPEEAGIGERGERCLAPRGQPAPVGLDE